jgi:uncharacterized metal-binding protein YceD (DUF177 family)
VKIHLRQIPADGLHLEGEEDCLLADLEQEDVRCAGSLQYKIDIGLSTGALWANGTLVQPVELRCVACLESFVHNIEVNSFAMHEELHGPETFDLTPFMREDLLLNLPPYPHCDRDGGRVCKATPLPVGETAADAQTKTQPDWSALDKLKLRK